MIIALIAGCAVWAVVWFVHPLVREKLVASHILRDRRLSYQAVERAVVSVALAVIVAGVAGGFAVSTALRRNYERFNSERAAISVRKPKQEPYASHARRAVMERGPSTVANGAEDDTGTEDSLDDDAGEQQDEEARGTDGKRGPIWVKKNFAVTLKGTIGGRHSLIMELESNDRRLTGVYYDEARMLDGRVDGEVTRGGDCVIHGYAAGDSLVEIFSGVFNNTVFAGSLQDADGNEKMPFRLEVVKKPPPLRVLFGKGR